MIDYQIAVVTYRRSKAILKDTLTALTAGGVPPDRITVFVSDTAETPLYREAIGDSFKIVEGDITLTGNRRFIASYYPTGTCVVMANDDIKQIAELSPDGKRTERCTDLPAHIERAFTLAKKHDLSLWGVYPINNSFYMKPTVTLGLCLLVGSFYGVILDKDYHYGKYDDKEDYERSFATFQREGALLRLNYLAVDCPYYNGVGPLGADGRVERSKRHAEYLARKYPEYCKSYIRKSTGYHELRLNFRQIPSQIIGKQNDPISRGAMA